VKTFPTTVHEGVVMLEVSVPEGQIALEPSCMARTTPRLPAMSAGD